MSSVASRAASCSRSAQHHRRQVAKQVTLDALLNLLLTSLDLARREAAVATVDGLEFTAINRHDGLRKEVPLSAHGNEALADAADASAVAPAEVRNGLEVQRKAPGQPHELDIALCFALQAAARLDTAELAVNVELEQVQPGESPRLN